jgi:hypothetical protein
VSRFTYTWLVALLLASVLLATAFNDRLDPYMMQVIAMAVFVVGFACACGSLLLKGACYWWVSDRVLRSHSRLHHLEKFRAKYAVVAKETLKLHSEGCQTGSEKRLAQCVVPKLANEMKARYAFVRYDEGRRCEIAGRLTDPTYQGKSVCNASSKQRH